MPVRVWGPRFWFTGLIILATAIVLGCGSDKPEPRLAPSPTAVLSIVSQPRPTPTIEQILRDPRQLVLQRGDLPAGFGEPLGEYRGANVYNVAYLRLQALAHQDPSRTHLLGVLSSVGIYESIEVASTEFEAEGTQDAGAVQREISEATSNVTDIAVSPTIVSLDGADRALGFRIAYSAGDFRVVGYRYRFTVANSVATVIVMARAPAYPEEPPELRDVAIDIALRQIAHLKSP